MNFDLMPARRGSVAVRELLPTVRAPLWPTIFIVLLIAPFYPLANINHFGSYALPPA
jgi:hypothetical protein